jgi:membrane-bound metal-dependent hydrolase YbcI (DUF457 family)
VFIGHFGVGLAAKALAPRVSLGSLFLAAQLIDLLWPTLLLLGLERVRIAPGITAVTPLDFAHYPITHSLLGAALWALGLSVLYLFATRYRRGALVLLALVISHWVLDLIVHRPDLPLYPGGAKFGFGLWNSVTGSLAIELAILAAGTFLYLKSTKAVDRVGVWAFWSLISFLLLIHTGNLLGPPPPSVAAIAWVGQAQWLLVLWGYWVDRHRATRSVPPIP